MNALLRLLARLGHYYSTHCQHGFHELCKGTCKHCDKRCRCRCRHVRAEATPEASLEELARLGVDFKLSYDEGTWALTYEGGSAKDCTLSSCIERILHQVRARRAEQG